MLGIVPAKADDLNKTLDSLNKVIHITADEKKEFWHIAPRYHRYEFIPLKLTLSEPPWIWLKIKIVGDLCDFGLTTSFCVFTWCLWRNLDVWQFSCFLRTKSWFVNILWFCSTCWDFEIKKSDFLWFSSIPGPPPHSPPVVPPSCPQPPGPLRTAPGPRAAAVVHCSSGGPHQAPRTAPGPTAAAVAYCSSGGPRPHGGGQWQ